MKFITEPLIQRRCGYLTDYPVHSTHRCIEWDSKYYADQSGKTSLVRMREVILIRGTYLVRATSILRESMILMSRVCRTFSSVRRMTTNSARIGGTV